MIMEKVSIIAKGSRLRLSWISWLTLSTEAEIPVRFALSWGVKNVILAADSFGSSLGSANIIMVSWALSMLVETGPKLFVSYLTYRNYSGVTLCK